MKKKTAKKCFNGLMAGLLLASLPVALVDAELTSVGTNQNDTASPVPSDHAKSTFAIFISVEELTGQNISLLQMRGGLQDLLNDMLTEIQDKGQPCVSLRGFYRNEIFSARGFA